MKYMVFFLVATIVNQITATPSVRRRRGYLDHNADHSIIINPHDDNFHHPWWQGSGEDIEQKPMKPDGPFGSYESFEGSSEEDQGTTRKSGPPHKPGYGGGYWWRPPGPGSHPKPFGNNKQEQIERCIKSCPVTSEFNPVCGSNDITYGNLGRLECEQRCGVDVKLSRRTACSVPPPNQPDLNLTLESVVACVKNCPVTTEYNPVCGSNNVTYGNHGRLLCDQYCGIPVELSKLSACSNSEQPSERPLTAEQQAACMRSCPVTEEYNPVCGSNNVTYSNLGRLECAQSCGVTVTLIKISACGGSELTTTTDNSLSVEGFAALCMSSCPVTSEYNPVCGSNNVTYINPGRLECAQNCGVAVILERYSTCETHLSAVENKTTTTYPYVNDNGDYDSNVGNNKPSNTDTDVNSNLNTGNNGGNGGGVSEGNSANLNSENKDNNNGEHGGNNNLPSGSNGNDYHHNSGHNNLDGENKEILSGSKGQSGSEEYNGNNPYGGNGGSNSNYGNKNCNGVVNNRKPPSLQEVMECMQTCSLTSEYNPVCGTDSITYLNPGRLLCSQYCGVDVKLKKFAPCASNTVTNVQCLTTCTNPPVTDNPDVVTPPVPSIEACMESCPSSLQFKPVCGSNNVTYRNLDKLQCARRCGIDVSLKREAHCSAPEVTPDPKDNATLFLECMEQCSVPQLYEPICGTNNVTYNNTEHLICARQCGLDVQVKQSQRCSTTPNVTPSPPVTPTTETVVNPNQNGLNFTIDPDILASIWGTESSKDGDEDFDLDQRVQDQQ